MRNPYFDRVKGIGILFVYLGHLVLYDSDLFRVIFNFHMPLFFLVSGVFFRAPSRDFGDRQFWRKMLINIGIPLAFFAAVAAFAAIFGAAQRLPPPKDCFPHWLVAIACTWHYGLPFVPSAWFLFALAGTQAATWMLCRRFGNRKRIFVIAIASAYLLGCWIAQLSPYFKVLFPLMTSSIPLALVFFIIGYLSRHHLTSFSKRTICLPHLISFSCLILLLILIEVVLSIACCDKSPNLAIPHCPCPCAFPIASLAGIAAVLITAKTFRWNALSWIGERSLHFFLLESYSVRIVISVLRKIAPPPLDAIPFSPLINPLSWKCIIMVFFSSLIVSACVSLFSVRLLNKIKNLCNHSTLLTIA